MKLKFALAAAAVGSMFAATIAVSPAAAFSGRHHAHKGHHHHGHHHRHHGHRHHRWHHARFRYEPRHRYGHRPDCYQMRRRAVLTGNWYWRYAAHSCRHDYYRKAY